MIISEDSKLSQKEYQTRHDRVGKVIHWELCKKLKFDYTNKWCMYNPESVLKNEMRKILWDFEIQTDHQISARWPDLVIVKKSIKRKRENLINSGRCRTGWPLSKNKRKKKRDKYLDLARELKKPTKHESDGDKVKVKLAIVVKGDPMAPFSIATTPRCREGRYFFPWTAPLYLDPHLIVLSVKQGDIEYHFLSLWYDSTWDWTLVSRAIGKL